MIRLWAIAVCLTLSLPLPLIAAPPAKAISWMQADLPPQFIFDGDLAGQGWSDRQLATLIPLLPDFDHHQVQGSLSRIWYEMAHRDGICFNGAARTVEREDFAVYSRRPILVPLYRVIVRASDRERFRPFLDSSGAIDLERLGEVEGFSGGYVAAREHFPAINRFIESDRRRTRLETAVSTSQLFNLLHAKRLDFIISSPVEAPYYQARFHLSDEFVSLKVAGGLASIRGYIVCSKGPLGRAVIARIDALLADDPHWTAYIEPLRRWLDPADFALALAVRPESDPPAK